MEEIYYVDRPSIPATQQVIVKLDSIFEHALYIDAGDINQGYCGYGVEVKDADGYVNGTLVFFPCVSYAELTSPDSDEDTGVFADEPTADDGVDVEESAQDSLDSCNVAEDAGSEDGVLNAIREDRLLNLELELSAAKQLVQDLEDEIADEEGALD